jgi:putative transposase
LTRHRHPQTPLLREGNGRRPTYWTRATGPAREAQFILRDRDAKFAPAFDRCFRDGGARIVKTPVQAPNANAFAETWVGSVKRECLSHFLCFSLGHLDHILAEYARYYNKHRPHQSLGNRTLTSSAEGPSPPVNDADIGPIHCQRFLGGLLRHYYRDAA